MTPVRPPTPSQESNHFFTAFVSSVDCLLQLLHWQAAHCLACRLGFEDARLLGERIDSLACWSCRLLLQFHVEDTTQFETAILLQFTCCQIQVSCDDSFNLFWLQFSRLCNSSKCTTCSDCTPLAGLHCL